MGDGTCDWGRRYHNSTDGWLVVASRGRGTVLETTDIGFRVFTDFGGDSWLGVEN